MYKSWELIAFALFVVGIVVLGIGVQVIDRRVTNVEDSEAEPEPVAGTKDTPSSKPGHQGAARRRKRKHGR